MPLIVSGVVGEKRLWKEIKKIGLTKHDIGRVYFANTDALVYLKDESLCKVYEHLVPDRETEIEIKTVHEYVEKFKYLIDVERLAEMEFQEKEIKRLSGRERELLGRAILDLKGSKSGIKFHMQLVRFWRDKPIETEIGAGDIVLVSRGNPLKSDLLATVLKITEKTVLVAFDNKPPQWIFKKGVRLDLYVNDITFKRMEENLEEVRHTAGRKREIRNIILGLKAPLSCKEESFELFDKRLNISQKTAVSRSLGSQDFYLIHGPPGTGKTSTVTELILQLVKRKNRVLATADSNIAADNLLLNLSKNKDLNLVRIGHPARVLEELEEFSIFALFEKHEKSGIIKKGWKKVRELIEKREQFLKPIPSLRRGMRDEEIIHLGKKGKSFRGTPAKKIKSMANWLLANYEIDIRINSLKDMEKHLFNEIIAEADIVISTNSMVKSEFLEGFEFDVAVIDEGSQQVEPSTLIPIMRAKRFFIAGDHKQLPPTVTSKDSKELEKTLFERLIQAYKNFSSMLTVQYRMNEKIMSFPSSEFYERKLIADESVINHTICDFELSPPPENYMDILESFQPVVFVDTSQVNAFEFKPSGSTSYENYEEAVLCVKFASALIKMGLDRKHIGVITPYSNQVKLIKELFSEKDIKVEVNSVDGFQGREKEVIIISFVRSNDTGELGFLKDIRRLNVAITRPKRKLITIGNSGTLSTFSVYERFINYVEEEGKFVVFG